MESIHNLLIWPLLALLSACALPGTESRHEPLRTVDHVDLNRYLGKWYEIARFDHRFQRGCGPAAATYSQRSDGRISVLNECIEASTGETRRARGKAWVVDPQSNAKLKVSFFWPFAGDYWIIALGKNYEYAVVGHPDRTYLWILSRTRTMEDSLYRSILDKLKGQGYDVSKLIYTAPREPGSP